MTIDKEMLIKHRFWISLGVFVVLLLVGVILIPTVQGSTNASLLKAYLDKKRAVEGINDPKTEKFRDPLVTKEGELKKQKNKVWAEAYKPQADLMTWPVGGNARLSERLSQAYFGDYISLDHRSEYGSKLYGQYLDSLGLADMVKPVEFSGDWKHVIRPVSKWELDRPPTIEECWLAQEDLWVKRELLSIIQETLDSIRVFKEYDPKTETKEVTEAKELAKEPAKEPAKKEAAPSTAKLMRNANWELNLIVEPDQKTGGKKISEKSTFKNINPWKRALSLADVHFRVRQGGGDNYLEFTVPVDRVPGGETTDFKLSIPFGKFRADPAKPLEVEQLLTWQTSPIKRIDALELGYNSHRTANRTCKAKQIGTAGEDEKKEAARGGPGGPEVPAGASAPGMPSSPMPGGFGGGGGGGSKGLNADLRRERYLDFTEQVRWMPVGMVLIVDQQYMPDLQVAVANSRLRIQPTQIAYHRAYGIRSTAPTGGPSNSPERKNQPTGPVTKEIGEGGAGVAGRYGPTSSPIPTGPGGKVGGIFTPSGPGGYTSGGASSTSSEDDPNLMELSIYGIASLYERFPPKAQAAAKP